MQFSQWLLPLGLALMVFILMRRWYRQRSRVRRQTKQEGKEPKKDPRSQREPSTDLPLLDAPPNVSRWYVEMHTVSRYTKAELDSKMVALQVLIRLANESVEQLETLLKRMEQAGVVDQAEAMQRLVAELRRRLEASSELPPGADLPPMPRWGADGFYRND